MCKKLLVLLLLVALTAGVASAELRAWYKFDETSDANVADSSGNGFDTVVSGVGTTPEWDTEGAMGGCLQETGLWTAMYVDVPAAVFSTMDDEATFSWWVQLTPTSAGGGWFTGKNTSSDQMIKAIPYPSGEDWYGVYTAGSTATNWWWGYGANTEEGEWHHFALVFDSVAGIKKLYFNGEVVSNPGITEGDSMADIDVFKLFSRTAAAPAAWDVFKGKMDDIRIYDEALSADDVAELLIRDEAWGPNPYDGKDVAACICEEVTLLWNSGRYAASHDVYFGTDYNDVEDANHDSDEFMDNQEENYFETSGITPNTTYYWRVDEVNDSNTWTGDVWSYCPNDLVITYYVDADDGNDLDDGLSTSTAWETLSKVNAKTFEPCDKVLFKADCQWSGQFVPKGSGTEYGYIQADSYGTVAGDANKPRIDAGGSHGTALSINEVEYWDVNNLQLTNYGGTAADWRTAVSISASDFGTMDHVHLQNLYVHSVNSTEGTGGGISWFCSSNSGVMTKFDDILIEDCLIESLGSWGIHGGNSHCGRIETATDPDNTKDFYPSTNVVIRGNRISDIDSSGIVIIGTDGCIVEDNVIDQTMASQGGCAIWPWSADNTIIQYNEVYDVYDNGDGESYDSDYNCKGSIFQYNYSHDNPGGFMRICNGGDSTQGITGNFDTIVRYNVSIDDGSSTDAIFPTWKRCDNVKIYNNVIYSPEATVPLVDTSASGGSGAIWYWWNNIFYSNGILRYDITDGSTNYWDYNCFYGTHQIKNWFWWVSGTPSDSNKITSNPNFVNTSTLDGFQIQSGSPCEDAGKTVSNNGDYDFWGNDLYNDDPDIGAHERP